MFPFFSVVILNNEVSYYLSVHPILILLWNWSFFYQVFSVILPWAAGRQRTATSPLHKWQNTEAAGCMLEVFSNRREAFMQGLPAALCSILSVEVLPSEPKKETMSWGIALHGLQIKSKQLKQLHLASMMEITRHAVGVTEQLTKQLLTQFQLTLIRWAVNSRSWGTVSWETEPSVRWGRACGKPQSKLPLLVNQNPVTDVEEYQDIQDITVNAP